MTKALVTIEVDVETGRDATSGLGESSNPSHPGQRFLQDEKRGFIWESVHDWLKSHPEFKTVVKVSLPKEA